MKSNRVKRAVKLYKSLPHSKIILCNEELVSDEINRRFRETYYGSVQHIQNSEIIIFKNVNNHNVNIDNAFGIVTNTSSDIITREVSIMYDNISLVEKLTWRWVKVNLFDSENNSIELEGFIVDELIDNKISIKLVNDFLLKDFSQRHTHLKLNSPDYNKYLHNDKFYNILHLDYGYSTKYEFICTRVWKNIVVVESNISGLKSLNFHQI